MASDDFLMIVAVYFILGIFMIRTARNPLANASRMGLVMAWEAFRTPSMTGPCSLPHWSSGLC